MLPNPDRLTAGVGSLLAYVENAVEVLRFGGLQTDEQPSPYDVVARRPMYRLRRYFPEGQGEEGTSRPPIVLVPPMMLSAEVWDVSPATSAVAALHRAGLDPWVVDFGSPDQEAGGLERTLTDHVIALSEVVDLVHGRTGREVHLGGYSQGGMFCYQAAAFRRSRHLGSVITFGSPVDITSNAPLGLPEDVAIRAAEFLADHVFARRPLPGWMASAGFRLLDPVKTAQAQWDFLRQLHNRDALLGRERQRRFLAGEGFVAWSGPAIVELLRQFVVHNRMMVGGFVIGEQLVSLADVTCPVLAFVGDIDDIGQPAAVRGIERAAVSAEVYEFTMHAGHFGLVVGSAATGTTWPTVADWIRWCEGEGLLPDGVRPMRDVETTPAPGPLAVIGVATQGLGQIAGMGVGAARGVARRATGTAVATRAMGGEAVRALPRLVRLGQIQSGTAVSFGRVLSEQAAANPDGACFLFDDRVHTYGAVNTRIDNVVKGLVHVGVRQGDHVGVLMETRPSALVTIAALSRLGAVAVLLPPVEDLSAALRLGNVADVVVDPEHATRVAAAGARALVLGGGGEDRDLTATLGVDVVDLERIDPDAVELPGWYRPNPGLARDLAFVLFSAADGTLATKLITNHRWALSAFGAASAASLTSASTVYCITPLHHPSGLLTSVGGAVAGGARIALSRGFDPDRFDEEVRRYGVTVVSYTWAMMRELVRRPASSQPPRSIELFIGSGMPRGLWRRVTERYAPAKVVEFYASTEHDVILANLSGAKPGSRGRRLPGTAKVRLAAVDIHDGRLLIGDGGFAIPSPEGAPGLLLASPRLHLDASIRKLRGVFRPGDTWVATQDLFVQDADGDLWLLGDQRSVVRTSHGPVFPLQVSDALGDLAEVDLAVTYAVTGGGAPVAVAAVTLWDDCELTAADVSGALAEVPLSQRPDVVHVVPSMTLTTWYRPTADGLPRDRLPEPGERVWWLDGDTGSYVPLTEAARVLLAGS